MNTQSSVSKKLPVLYVTSSTAISSATTPNTESDKRLLQNETHEPSPRFIMKLVISMPSATSRDRLPK